MLQPTRAMRSFGPKRASISRLSCAASTGKPSRPSAGLSDGTRHSTPRASRSRRRKPKARHSVWKIPWTMTMRVTGIGAVFPPALPAARETAASKQEITFLMAA